MIDLVKKYKEYIALLSAELNDLASFVNTHRWKSNRAEEGKQLRAEIADLEKKYIEPPNQDSDSTLIWSLIPAWVKDQPEGLDATFYGTGSSLGDQEIKKKVEAVIGRMERSNEILALANKLSAHIVNSRPETEIGGYIESLAHDLQTRLD